LAGLSGDDLPLRDRERQRETERDRERQRERDYTYLFHYIFLAKGQMNTNSAPEAEPKETACELKHVR
jgi:hypothetical protein